MNGNECLKRVKIRVNILKYLSFLITQDKEGYYRSKIITGFSRHRKS